MTLAVLAIGSAWAGDKYKLSLNGSNEEYKNGTKQSALSFFSYNSSKHNFNTKFNGLTYDDISYTSGLKMEGATSVSWTSTATATVTIVQSNWNTTNTIKFDGTELAIANAEAITGGYVHTISNVAAGSHSVTRGSGENGVFCIIVEYTGTVMTQLDAPLISATGDGSVTISSDDNATSTYYTTNGTDPSATNGTEYTAAFTVADGTTVKAISIGDGTTYANSSIASKVIYLDNVTCADPIISSINGTIVISCSTANATIKYSTDGNTFSTYAAPQTYFTATTIYAKAERDGAIASQVVSQEVEAAPAAANGSQTKILGFVTPADNNDWQNMTSGSLNYGIEGKAGTDEEGWSLWISPNSSSSYDKGISGDASGNSTYTISGTAYQYIKNSNGRQFNIGLPEGVTANRLTVYSFNNGTPSSTSLWSNVGGTTYNSSTEVGLVATAGNAPDIRVFPLNNVTENIILTNNGAMQQCFIVVVDYTVSEEATVQFKFTAKADWNNSTQTVKKVTSTFAKSEGADISIQNDYVSLKKLNTLTIRAESGYVISKIELSYVDDYSPNDNTVEANLGAINSEGTLWTGIAKSVVLTKSAGSNDSRVNALKVTYVPAVDVTLASSGVSSFSSAQNLDFTNVEGVKAYVVSDITKTAAMLTQVTQVPAGTGLILKGTGGETYAIPVAAEAPAAITTNKLFAAVEVTNVDASTTYVINGGVFKIFTGTTIPAGKAYLNKSDVPEGSRLAMFFDGEEGEVSGISEAFADNGSMGNGKVYNLQGQRISQPRKGLNIIGGKKFFIK